MKTVRSVAPINLSSPEIPIHRLQLSQVDEQRESPQRIPFESYAHEVLFAFIDRTRITRSRITQPNDECN